MTTKRRKLSGFMMASSPSTSQTFSGSGAYLWGFTAEQTPPNNGGSSGAITPNLLLLMLFYVPYSITISKVTVDFTAVSAIANTFASFGIYSVSGNKIVDSGQFNVSVGQPTGIKTNNITPVTIQPGFYYLAETCNGAAPSWLIFAATTNPQTIMNTNAVRFASGVATVNGILPAAAGALTAAGIGSIPYVLFE